VEKCQGPMAGKGLLGPPASELKTFKKYISANYNSLKIFIYYIFFI
jgi:hypothetical protein